MRLRHVDPTSAGFGRRRSGRGFAYVDQHHHRITDGDTIDRIQALVIPPAWEDVWITPDPRGHLQATGRDAAGRRQYLYHPAWHERRAKRKFEHVLDVAARLPRLRRRVRADLDPDGLTKASVVATAVSVIDLGLLRVGSDRYATGAHPTFGTATLEAQQVSIHDGAVHLDFAAKGSIQQITSIDDADTVAVLQALRRRRRGDDRLFAFRHDDQWRPVHSTDINAYLSDAAGIEMSAKDLRTWHATVRAAIGLSTATGDPAATKSATARKRTITRVVHDVADALDDTAAVARSAYIDPRVIDLFLSGEVIAAPARARGRRPNMTAERAVLHLLRPA